MIASSGAIVATNGNARERGRRPVDAGEGRGGEASGVDTAASYARFGGEFVLSPPIMATASRTRLVGTALTIVAIAAGAPACQGCKQKGGGNGAAATSASASGSTFGLSPEQSARALAKFGEHVITLGEFAQALNDMPQIERLRYQALERRKDLLKNMIDVQLLADEAKKLGLDRDPAVLDEQRQILVAWMRAQLAKQIPTPNELPETEVRAWYDAHADLFDDPERRRVAQIVSGSEDAAKKAYDEAKVAAPNGWGPIVARYSDEKPGATEAPEMAGDLGFVTAPTDTHATPNPKATPAVRTAAFALAKVGDVSAPFKDDKGWHVLKLIAKNDARHQSFADVQHTVRTRLAQDRRAAAEKALIEEIRKSTKIEIDEGSLAAAASGMAIGPTPSPSVSAGASASASASGSAAKK